MRTRAARFERGPNARAVFRLLLGLSVMGLLVGYVLPALQHTAWVQRFLEPALRRDIDVSATFYTDLPHSVAAERYLRERLTSR